MPIRFKYKNHEIIELIGLSALVFSTASFLSFLYLKFGSDFREMWLGFPLKYYHEYRTDLSTVKNSWQIINFIFDLIASLVISAFIQKATLVEHTHRRIITCILIIFYAIMLFCCLSFIGIIKGALTNCDYSLGFPLIYHKQFWLNGNDGPNHGTIIRNFVIDCSICILLSFLFRTILKKRGK